MFRTRAVARRGPAPDDAGTRELDDILPPAPAPRLDLRGPLVELPPAPHARRSARTRVATIGASTAVGEAVLAGLAAAGAIGGALLAIAMAVVAVAGVAAIARRPAPRTPLALPAPSVAREPEAVVATRAAGDPPRDVVADLPLLDAEARTAVARALAAADAPGPLLAALLDDDDEDVRAAAVQSLAAQARGGATVPDELATRVVDRERATLAALLAIRPAPRAAPALHVAEVDRALLATAERLRDLALAAPALRTAVEHALATPVTRVSRALVEPWLSSLLAGDHALREPAIAALRACPRFAALPGRRADDVATRADRRWLARGDVLYRRGDPAGPIYIVVSGALAVDGDGGVLGPGTTVGVLAPRAATVRATELTQVLAIDRETFAAVAHDPRPQPPGASEN